MYYTAEYVCEKKQLIEGPWSRIEVSPLPLSHTSTPYLSLSLPLPPPPPPPFQLLSQHISRQKLFPLYTRYLIIACPSISYIQYEKVYEYLRKRMIVIILLPILCYIHCAFILRSCVLVKDLFRLIFSCPPIGQQVWHHSRPNTWCVIRPFYWTPPSFL